MAFISKTATSKDGTQIAYQQVGSGNGLILVHGAGRSGKDFRKLALALAGNFAVYIYDRRGRGASGKINEDHSIEKECEDLISIIEATNSIFIFGHSFGGLITLETVLIYPVSKMAIYDPGISINNSLPTFWLADFDKAIAKNKMAKAMVIAFKGLQLHKIGKLPAWILTLLLKLLLLNEDKEPGTQIAIVLPTMATDIRIILKHDSTTDRYQKIQIPVLLLGGSESPLFLKAIMQPLGKVLQKSQTYIYPKFGHYEPEEKVNEIAATLTDFFK